MTTPQAEAAYLFSHVMKHAGKKEVVFNPNNLPLDELPSIFCYSNVVGGGDGEALAMASDGHVLGSHWCSDEGYVSHDLGVFEGGLRPELHDAYQKHFPNGYKMEFVRAKDVLSHAGLSKAYELNQKLARDLKPVEGK